MKHVEDWNKQIIEETVRHVDHLPKLYQDARSEKYKILGYVRTRYFKLQTDRQKERGEIVQETSVCERPECVNKWPYFMLMMMVVVVYIA
jgi:hypothetical protein